jgi:acyl transferase domain-containing protein
MTANFVDHLNNNPEASLADIAYTLQVGRRTFKHRWMLVACDPLDAALAVSTLGTRRVYTGTAEEGRARPIVFMFPGAGAQYVNMAAELYRTETAFREVVDVCSEILKPHLGGDLREVLYPSEEDIEKASDLLRQATIMQPALFVIEYALATLWMTWGVRPSAMIGHSLGEFVAATLAGVFSLEDALPLVVKRARLIQERPPGTMLSVPLPEAEVLPLLGDELSLAAVNGPSICVVSGTTQAIEALEDELIDRDIEGQRLQTSVAFHSWLMEPAVEPFREELKRVTLNPPKIPIVSNVTGEWLTPEQATSPEHWATHMRKPVLFSEGIKQVLMDPDRILLEIGPGRTLSTLVREHPKKGAGRIVLPSLRHPHDRQSGAIAPAEPR